MIIDLTPTEDQQLIVESVSGLLARLLPLDRLRQPENHGGAAERAHWAEFAELGLLGLAEAGYGLPEETLVALAFGRHLASPSLLATLAGAPLAPTGRAAFANALPDGPAQLIDGTEAGAFLLLGYSGAVLVKADAVQSRQAAVSIDETLTLEHGSIHATPQDGEAADRISLLLAAYCVGIAKATCDMAVAYAKTREQFGQPIGAFQAIKHACADMAVRAAAAETQTFYAAASGPGPGFRREVASARLLAGEAALANAAANIQIHGAMGFTAEADAHLYLKRAHVMTTLGSSRRREQARIMM